MARGNRLLGTLRGKLGDTVYYRSRGYQIERPRVVPKNPRTRAQMTQRVKIANVSAIYRALKPVLSRSFVVRGQHESSFNAFSRAALPQSPYMTKSMVAECLALPMSAQLSRGGLGTYIYTGLEIGGEIAFVRLPSYITTDSAPTVSLWSQYFLLENPQFQEGDTIVVAMIQFKSNGYVSNDDAYNAVGKYASIVLNLSDDRSITEVGFGVEQSSKTLVPLGWPTEDAINAEDFVAMSGAFVSRKTENGDIDVSSQYFVLTQAAHDLYSDFHDNAALNAAIESYGVGNDRVV